MSHVDFKKYKFGLLLSKSCKTERKHNRGGYRISERERNC